MPPYPPTNWLYDSTFYSRMETWAAFYYTNTPTNWTGPGQLFSYGAYVSKSGAHGQGRGFDLSRIYLKVSDIGTRVFNGRYDEWRSLTGSSLTMTRKYYWAGAASLHYHFRNVLTYLYNSDHWNHIHIDISYQVHQTRTSTPHQWLRFNSFKRVWLISGAIHSASTATTARRLRASRAKLWPVAAPLDPWEHRATGSASVCQQHASALESKRID